MDMAMAEEGGKQMENTNKIDLIEWIQKAFHVVHKTWKALILLVAFCSMVRMSAHTWSSSAAQC